MNIKTIVKELRDRTKKMDISLKQKISIIGLGSISTLLVLLMLEVMMAQIITNTILNNINDNLMLLIIIIGLFLMTIVIAFIVGYSITQDIALKSVRNASTMSLMCLLLFLFIVSNGSLLIFYRNVYQNIFGFQILLVFPQVLVYFSIYVLNDVFNLFILTIVVYYVFFVIFLEKLYQLRFKEVKNRE